MNYLGMISLFGAGVILAGCRATPATEIKYLPKRTLERIKFDSEDVNERIWFSKDIKKYRKVKVNVILSDDMIEGSFLADMTFREIVAEKNEDFKELCKYIKESFSQELKKSDYFVETDNVDDETVVLNFAVVQIIRGKPGIGAVSNATTVVSAVILPLNLVFLPLKIGFQTLNDEHNGVIAMEALLTDKKEQVLGVVIDRQKGVASVINFNDFSTYGSIKNNIDNWSYNFVKALDDIKCGEKPVFEELLPVNIIDY